MILILAILAVAACSPTPEEEAQAIKDQLADHLDCSISEVEDLLSISVRENSDGRVYVIDSDMVITDANFVDAVQIYSGILGCVHRGIESHEGVVKVGFTSLWFVMDLEDVHALSDLAESGCSGSEFMDFMEESIEFIDR